MRDEGQHELLLRFLPESGLVWLALVSASGVFLHIRDAFPAALIYTAIWSVRYRYDQVRTAHELKCIAGLALWIYSIFWYNAASSRIGYLMEKRFVCFQCWIEIIGFLNTVICATCILQVNASELKIEIEPGRDRQRAQTIREEINPDTPLRPLIFPSRTSHTRIFPKKHSFSYSYLLVGIPVGWRGSIGKFLSSDLQSLPWRGPAPTPAWFSVESADHLDRGDNKLGLQGKLDVFLESQVAIFFAAPSLVHLHFFRMSALKITLIPISSLHLIFWATRSIQYHFGICTTSM